MKSSNMRRDLATLLDRHGMLLIAALSMLSLLSVAWVSQ